MIDPIHSLAFSIQSNRGVYAALLGSGVSRSAKIPTGWEITLDLVRKLAEVSGKVCEPSPEAWYRENYGKDPDYSELLDALAKTPTERQQLLRAYWEASDEDREEGVKQPTPAHRAIASLVARGFVKVIITTNFDRLMETALADEGISPSVLGTPDQVHGALPLIHTRCCVFKVHGDYLDTRIKNTPSELGIYPPDFDALLDRIFDEFGLVVCGWSADWDEALRAALFRAPSRRFTTYWTARGEPSGAARSVIDHRGAQVVAIKDADSFFTSLQQQVQSLEEFSRPHPLSTEAAVASLKRYLTKPEHRIQLVDLIGDEVERVMETTSGPKFSIEGGPALSTQTITARIRAYEAACGTLIAMGIHGGYWAEETHYRAWQSALAALSIRRQQAGLVAWVQLQQYPATLLLYSLGMGAVEADRIQFLATLCRTSVARENREDLPAVQLLPPFCIFDGAGIPQMLEGMKNRYAPLNDWLYSLLRPLMKRMIPNDERFTLVFDKLEILLALGYGHLALRTKDWYWAPPGAYGYRGDSRIRVVKEVEDSIAKFGNDSLFVRSGLFGNSATECTESLSSFGEFVREVTRQWR